jgi:transcriptional regulator with XRE-family HTH domain
MLPSTESYTTFLAEELARRMRANPRYSQRAFARQLGMSPGELSEILRGRRKLSLKATLKVAKALGLNESVELPHRNQLTLDMFNIISDWYCFAILNLAECEDFRWDESWIARRLAISVAEVRAGIDRLERVGLLERRKGKLVVSRDYVISPEGIPSEAIRNYHRQMLHRASQALESQALDEREIAGIDLALHPKLLPAIKKDISDFLDELVAKYARGRQRREVYHCEVAFFRLTAASRENSGGTHD